jgi:hypothetical protein
VAFRDKLAVDARRTFLESGKFAEPVTYYPEGQECDPRPINAVVDRSPPRQVGEDEGRANVAEFTLLVGNDPTNTWGIGKIEVGKDLVDCPLLEGGDPVRWRVVEILEQDPGMWTLLIAGGAE